MTHHHPPHDQHGPPALHWHAVRVGRQRSTVAEMGLVLTAVGIPHRLEERIGGWTLLVDESHVARALEELGDYLEEASEEPAPVAIVPPVDDGRWGILGFLVVIWAVPFLQGEAAFGPEMIGAGRMQAGRVEAGEWWRTITALTLHADSGHILSNSAFGAFFGLYVARGLGSGVGWLLVLVAGALGNGANALIQSDAFRSIGASTATFGALGLFAAVAWARGEIRRGRGWRRALAPLFAGFALVVWTGTGGENTDVMAHFTGFGAGVLLGALAGRASRDALARPALQLLAGAIAFFVPVLAWYVALTP